MTKKDDAVVTKKHELALAPALRGTALPVTKKDVVEGAEGIGPLAGDTVQAMYGMPDRATAYFGSKKDAAGRPSRYASPPAARRAS